MNPTTIIQGYQPPASTIAALNGTKATKICALMPRSMAKLRVHMPKA